MRVRLSTGCLTDVFAAYRACMALLAGTPGARSPAIVKFKGAMDPDLIHGSRVYGGQPRGWDSLALSPEEDEWATYVAWVSDRVGRLPRLQRDLITVQYLSDRRVLTDPECLTILHAGGYRVEMTTLQAERQKAFAYLEGYFFRSDLGF